MSADSDAAHALQQTLALAHRLGAAATYADLLALAVAAFDDGELHAAALLRPDGPGLDASRFTTLASWERAPGAGPPLGPDALPLAHAGAAEPAAVPDVAGDSRLGEGERALLRERGVGAYLALPLRLGGAPAGVIALAWPAPRAFGPAALALAATAMAVAPGTAERIRLGEEARAQREELRALRSGLEGQVLEQTAELRTFQAIVEEALDAVAIATPAGIVVYGNQAFASMTGFGDRVVGSAIPDYHPPEELPFVTGQVLPALFNTGRWQGRLRLRRPDGTEWVGQLSAFLLRDPQGRPEAVAGFYRDVTAERERAEELARANQRLEQSFLTSPLATLEADHHGIIRRWNPAAEQIFGWAAEEAIGRNALELLVPGLAREHVAGVVAALLSGDATNSRNVNVRKDGQLITCQWHNAVLRDSNGEVLGWLSQTQDITEQLRAEEERTAMQEQVIEAQRAALRELSTPIIPIGDGVVALPLIGSVDSARAQQVIEGLLDGVATLGAHTAILDITGVPVVDTQVADALLRAARAVKLLGARVVLTGIRPEVAQTLVGLGLDMSGVVTLATLQSGIRFALGQGEGARTR